jgi:uncharacterized protein YggE
MTSVDRPATVAVTGTGRVERTADLALATFVIEATRPTAADARRDAAAAATAVIEALAGAGIRRDDLRTAGLDLVPNWEQEGDRAVRRGFTVTNRVGATIRDLELVGRVIDAGLLAGSTGLEGVQLVLADPAPAAEEARRLAVADARARAEVIASAAGLGLGRLVSIAEGGSAPGPEPRPEFRLAAVASDIQTPVLPGRIEVSVSVAATWELA